MACFFSFDWYIFSEVCSMKIIFYVSELLTPSFLYFMLHNRCLCWTNLRNLPSWQSFFTPLTQNRISGYFESYSSAHFLSPRTVPPPSSSLAVRCLEKNNLKVTTHMVGSLQTLPKIIIIMDRSSLKQQNATIVASSVNVRSPACTRYSWWCK